MDMKEKKGRQLTSDLVESLLKEQKTQLPAKEPPLTKSKEQPLLDDVQTLKISEDLSQTMDISRDVFAVNRELKDTKTDVSQSENSQHPPEKNSPTPFLERQFLDLPSPRNADPVLVQSEHLRIAQSRINDLEREVDCLRRENEELASACETLKRRGTEHLSAAEHAEKRFKESQDFFNAEKEIMRQSLHAKTLEVDELRSKVENLELRLSSDLKRIRVRERELENRLELMRMENTTLVRSKDEIILDLKRQIDQLTGEAENYRAKCQELYKQIEASREQFSRTVRALRIALAGLEGFGNELAIPLKKVE